MLHIKDIEAFARINEALAYGRDDGPVDPAELERRRVAAAMLFMRLAAGSLTKPPLMVPPPEFGTDPAQASVQEAPPDAPVAVEAAPAVEIPPGEVQAAPVEPVVPVETAVPSEAGAGAPSDSAPTAYRPMGPVTFMQRVLFGRRPS